MIARQSSATATRLIDEISRLHISDICRSNCASSSLTSPPYTSSFQKSLSSVLDDCARLCGLRLDSSRKKSPSSASSTSALFDSAFSFSLGGVAGGSVASSSAARSESARASSSGSALFVADRPVLVRVGLSLAPSASIHSLCAAARSNSASLDPSFDDPALTIHSGKGLTPTISPAFSSAALAAALASASIFASLLDLSRSTRSARSRSHCSLASFAVWPLTNV
mmetsp:Transcript_6250/g.25328  ORF Transcript_6250/g.25328 Transcript_6250/m.25328 type:complete len:225 (+) Transcript_6250:533-1207(+)